ncbi:MAG: BrnT family toxin [Ignavibacteria bacterium]|nr:BrnT family toxin [Ignavibacteria bacterium]
MKYKFEWNQSKADSNFVKHRVSFEESLTVFDDPLAFIFEDKKHSIIVKREIIIGHSSSGRLLIVVFNERSNKIRIISSRQTTKKERRNYEENI